MIRAEYAMHVVRGGRLIPLFVIPHASSLWRETGAADTLPRPVAPTSSDWKH